MIVLLWGMFLTTPSIGLAKNFDQTVMYSALLLTVLLTGRHSLTPAFIKSLTKMSKLNPRQLWHFGVKWGIPLQILKKILPQHQKIHRKRRTSYKRRGRKHLNKTITLYRKMPLKAMSRAWGKFNKLDLPVMLRKPLLGLYVWMFGCKLEEAADEELRNYKNLGEFFRRTLKPHVRNVSDDHSVTSPADGRILHFGEVANGILEQVKGVTYSLRGFLGPLTWLNQPDDGLHMTDQEYYEKMNIRPGNKLYHCIIYLAPGDYHRFHSATDWTVHYRRHFPGELLSVNPGVARWIQGLFNFNERVVYTGEWEHGFFSYTAVGATNVGSIKIYNDQDLNTNTGHEDHKNGSYFDRDFRHEENKGLLAFKGEMFGEFNLGSTIVLVFEAPENFQFCIDNEQKVKFGEPLGTSSE